MRISARSGLEEPRRCTTPASERSGPKVSKGNGRRFESAWLAKRRPKEMLMSIDKLTSLERRQVEMEYVVPLIRDLQAILGER